MKEKGMSYVSELALENAKALKAIVQWNHENGIRFFRYTVRHSAWCTPIHQVFKDAQA